nr:hypothetical protein [Tanacetum cinerariifolium]
MGISILLVVGTPSTGSGKLYCQWELSSSSGNVLCILFPTQTWETRVWEISTASRGSRKGKREGSLKRLKRKFPEVDESVNEGIPDKKPRFDDEEADVQTALEESLKSVYDAPRGPLPPVVIREPKSGKYQPLSEVQGKGKGKVINEQVGLDLLTLHTPKKKSHADQFIFQRRTSTPTESSGPDKSCSLYAELRLIDSELESDKDVLGIDVGVQDKGQARPNPDEPLQATATKTTTTKTTTTTLPPLPQPQQSTTDSMLMKRIGELEKIMTNLIQDNKHMEERDLPEADMKEILHQRMWETNSYKAHEDHMMMLSFSSTPKDLHMDDDMALDVQVHSFDDEDIKNAHISKLNLRQDWWKPLEEDRPATPKPVWSIPSSDLPVPKNNWASALASTYSPPSEDSLLVQTGDMAMLMDRFCKRQGITKLKSKDLEGPAFELVKVFHPNVTIQSYFFFNKDLECLRYGSKGSRHALSISKIKPAYYPDVGLEQMVPDQIHTSKGDRRAVKTHMQILSVGRIEVSLCHLNHLSPKDKKILTTAVILWTRHLVIKQCVEDFQIDEALDYRDKEFKVSRMNPGLNIRFWTRKDVDRSKEFMFAIQKLLKARRIFCNLESFVGRRVRDEDYRLPKRTE